MRVVVVGAGPAGLMAAEVAAAAGHEVSVYDQRRSPARKFVLAGRGGLNITHSEPLDEFLDRYGPERTQLEAAIRSFSPDDLRSWCAELGQETFIGTSGRVFPEAFRAVPLLRAWLVRLEGLGVTFHLGHRWFGWADDNTLSFETTEGSESVDTGTRNPDSNVHRIAVEYEKVVLALGGASWPKVGGDGSWAEMLRARGVEVTPLAPANCGVEVAWSDVMIERFAGEPVKNAAVIVDSHAVRGDPIVTRTGLEGGPIYAHSRTIRERLAAGLAEIEVDLFPDLDFDALEERLSSKHKRSDTTSNWLRRCGVTPVGASLMREATDNALPRDAAEVAELAKAVPITVKAMSGIDRAISSAGGVAWSEVDDTFQLHKIPNVYAVGEMLNWEAPTGGYLLQACFSTGRTAGAAIASEI